jgi:hypothetical protein
LIQKNFFSFFFLVEKEAKKQGRTIPPRLSPFSRKSKAGELKLLLRFSGKTLFTS